MRVKNIVQKNDPGYLKYGSISVKNNELCKHRLFRNLMIYQFCWIHKIRTINGEYMTDEFLDIHNQIWKNHKVLDENIRTGIDSNLGQEFLNGCLLFDLHDVRDNMDKTIEQRKIHKIKKEFNNKMFVNDDFSSHLRE